MKHDRHEYRQDCPGCQIALLDPETGCRMSPDAPEMKIALGVWNAATLEERRACNRVWVFNSRDPGDLRAMGEVTERIRKAGAS